MKKFKWILLGSIVLYVLFACGISLGIHSVENDDVRRYRVEINRAMDALKTKPLEELQQQTYEYIQAIEFLSEQSDETERQAFFLKDDPQETTIQPWYTNHTLQGYLKFTIQPSTSHIKQYLMMIQWALFLMELSILLILCYVYRQILRPFTKLQELPTQLAQGHYGADVKIEKGSYVKRFMWELSQMKDALEVSKKRQLELLKERKQLLLSLSHDIKTPLHLIKLYTKALQENVSLDQVSKEVTYELIEKKAIQIERYVDDIMRSSREELLDLPVENSEFYLSELMNNILQIYQEQCDLRSITLSVGDFENRLIKGDIERAQEVFENLFENAFKYGDGLRIELRFYEEDYCQLIRMFNTGKPVSDHELHHMFDSFFRCANSDGKQGSGLGLYICQELMRKMDGAIFAELCENGMAFTLVFR